jgi:hypothetical protein
MARVSRRRSLPTFLGVVLALATRTAVAAPTQTAAEMRAVSHCVGHMDRPVSVPESRRCCGVSAEAGAPATLAAAPASHPDARATIVMLAVAGAAPVARPFVAQDWRRGQRAGPPLYLGLRSFRC